MTESNVVADIRRLLEGLPAGDRRRLLAAMRSVHDVLGGRSRRDGAVLRPPRPGDLGWIVERNGALYAEECGWDRTYEASSPRSSPITCEVWRKKLNRARGA